MGVGLVPQKPLSLVELGCSCLTLEMGNLEKVPITSRILEADGLQMSS